MFNKVFKALLLKNPRTGEYDALLTLSFFIGAICAIKFLMDGVTITLEGHILTFGHMDAMSYASMLAPILGAHGYVDTRPQLREAKQKVDDPDL